MTVAREDLKYNFLRRIILRIDYNGVVDIKDTLKDLEIHMPKYGYVEMNTGFINDVEFEINDPVMIETQMTIPVKELQKTESFKFRTLKKDMVLEINNLFMTLTINSDEYYKFEDYSSQFVEIFSLLKDKNLYLKPLRLGLRKINSCIIYDKGNFEKFFNRKYFKDISTVFNQDGFTVETVNSQFVDTISYNNHYYNYIRVLSDAVLNIDGKDVPAYQVVLDIDGYNNDLIRLSDIIRDKTKLTYEFNEINQTLFDLYTMTLTDDFLSSLKSETFEFNNILGVNRNDRVQTQNC